MKPTYKLFILVCNFNLIKKQPESSKNPSRRLLLQTGIQFQVELTGILCNLSFFIGTLSADCERNHPALHNVSLPNLVIISKLAARHA